LFLELIDVEEAGKLFEYFDTVSLSYKQKNKFLSKEGAMKRIIMLVMVLVMVLVSIGGCCVGRGVDGRGGRGGEYDRNGENDRNGGYEKDDGHDMRNTIMKYI
jgi:hypothetical protein